jgi:hypothetical protein
MKYLTDIDKGILPRLVVCGFAGRSTVHVHPVHLHTPHFICGHSVPAHSHMIHSKRELGTDR